ncbi:hypothetical protein SKA34_04290 [Photobacterium sp. SKA34]|uniref:hypothetical protein n=1 Tax=Photobacterium sp. SKA34 TaxID=121723 RepID=UPI00006B34A4|nr:hypothetical protein [Photobacterium sp. SKA34]EAR53831.1 hypothetical protein SKA34_04290 [Photobacterium sp. SKA34]
MSSSTTGKTTKLNWKLSLLIGLLTGGALGAGIQHYNNVPVSTAYSTLKSDYQSVVDELNKEKLSVKQLTDEKALLVESSNQKLDALNLQLDKQKDQLKQLTEQLVTIQKQQETTKKLVVTKKKLNKEVVALKTKAKQQKEVIDNSNVLFEQKSKVQHDLAEVQKQMATLNPEIKKAKKACAEFKSGNSWNWVSQKDCDNYEALQKKLNTFKAQESQLKQSLATLNKKINA